MNTNSPTLEEQLKLEERVCPDCSYHVTNPLYERCPRCYAVLPKLELYCQGCLHHSHCPAVAAAEAGDHHEEGDRPARTHTERDSQTRS